MQVLRHGNGLKLVRLEISIDEFPKYLRKGIGDDGRFQEAEEHGKKLIASNFDIELSLRFVRKVCFWGSDSRISGKVIKRNTAEQIASVLKCAHRLTYEDKIAESLQKIVQLEGLSVSFGSKHLKFLDLGRHVVLDSIISERLGYTSDKAGIGYMKWRAACQEFLQILISENIECPGTGENWRVSDVEMAIYNKLNSRT